VSDPTNPYAPPVADVLPEGPAVARGTPSFGWHTPAEDYDPSQRLADALAGRRKLSAMRAMRMAWARVNGTKAPTFMAGLLLHLCTLVPPFLIQLGLVHQLGIAQHLPSLTERLAVASTELAFTLAAGVLTLPFNAMLYAGWTRYGLVGAVRRAPQEVGDIWPRRSKWQVLGLLAIVAAPGWFSSLSPWFGLPSFVMWIGGFLAFPLVVDRQLAPWTALALALRVAVRNVWPLLGIFLSVVSSYLLIAFTLGIAGLWWMPWCVHLLAVIYEELCGIETDGADSFAL